MSGLATGPATRAEVGPMISGGDVEISVLTTLRSWLPSYLAEFERAHDWHPGSTPAPRGWQISGRNSLGKFNEDQLPVVVLMAGGIISPPRAEGPPGVLTAIWGVDIGVMFGAAWGDSSRQHAQAYVRCVQLVLQQRPLEGPLENLGASLDFRGELYDQIDFTDTRSYATAVTSLDLEVRGICWTSGGPPPRVDPPVDPTDPLAPWVRVRETDVTVVKTDDPA